MSYEYKDEIIMNLKDYNAGRKVTGGTSSFESKLSELDLVYTQAAKADEYEAKAKSWDKYKEHMESHIAGEINEEELVSNLKSDYFESGEPND